MKFNPRTADGGSPGGVPRRASSPSRLLLLASLSALPAIGMAGVLEVEELSREGLDGQNAMSSMIASDGTVIGQLAGGADVVRWVPGQAPDLLGMDSFIGMTNLTPPISSDGRLVAVSRLWEDENQTHHISVNAWKQETGWVDLGDLGMERPVVLNAGPQGDALVGYAFFDAAFYHPWIWREGSGVEELAVPYGFDVGDAWAVSADTRVVVGSLGMHDPDGWGFHTWDHATRWVDGEAELLHDALNRPLSAALRCNSDCSVVVGGGIPPKGSAGDPQWGEAWVWHESTGTTYLGVVDGGAPPYYAIATSEDGGVVVGSYGRYRETEFGIAVDQHAFMWTPDTGIRPLDEVLADSGRSHLEGWDTSVATDITPDGQTILVGGWIDDESRSLLVHLYEQRPLLEPGQRVDVSGETDEAAVYRVEVPEGARDLRVMTARGSGDVSLYLDLDQVPTRSSHRHASTRAHRTLQVVRELEPEAGVWYASVIGDAPYRDVLLWATFEMPGGDVVVEPVSRIPR